jgi:Predicted symporter
MAVIFGGMVTAAVVLVSKLPDGLGVTGAAHVAGALGKLHAVDVSLDPTRRYTLWTGLLGGLFLSLSYFGTDQSQVQRYISGPSLRESRLGLVFNAILKIPMQFFILLLGAFLFVFYQFDHPPVFFNQSEWRRHAEAGHAETFRAIEERHEAAVDASQSATRAWLSARGSDDPAAEAAARSTMIEANRRAEAVRGEAKAALLAADPRAKTKDSDYVFITFILTELPHGAIGLLVAVMFSAALGSKAAELNALGTTTTIDFWRQLRPLAAATRRATCGWRGGSPPSGAWWRCPSPSSLGLPRTSSSPSTSSVDLLRRHPGDLPRGLLLPAGGGQRRLLGRGDRAGHRDRHVRVPESRLPLVQRDRVRHLHRESLSLQAVLGPRTPRDVTRAA